MTWPNVLTSLRIILTFFFIYFSLQQDFKSLLIAVFIFTAASLTDWLDGYLARKYNLISAWGKIMDPIADKFLTLSAFFIFAYQNIIAMWMVVLVALREVIVTVLRLKAISSGKVLAAETAGKIKTILQMVMITFVLSYLVLNASGLAQSKMYEFNIYIIKSFNGLMLLIVWITLYSGMGFILNNKEKLFER